MKKCSLYDVNKSIYVGLPGSSAGKQSVRNAGDLGSIPGSGRFPWRREATWEAHICNIHKVFPGGSVGKESAWRREQLPTLVFWPGEFCTTQAICALSFCVALTPSSISYIVPSWHSINPCFLIV